MHRIKSGQDLATAMTTLLKIDPQLVMVADKAGPLPLRLQKPGMEGLANIIVSQMISKASASALWKRLLDRTAGDVQAPTLLRLTDEACRSIGLSVAKTATLRRAADAVVENRLDLDAICELPADEAIRSLTAIKGIGRWTAEVYLMFSAGHPDLFPAGDVALQNAVSHALSPAQRLTEKTLATRAEIWSPWRSVAARLFWAYSSTEMRRNTLPVADQTQNEPEIIQGLHNSDKTDLV